MQEMKRQLSDNCNHFTDNRKKKISSQVTTHFEDLPNDLIYEIFEYLNYFHVYQSFFNLNLHFHQLVANSNFPIKINIASISKWSFYHFYNHIIKNNLHRVQSIAISNVCLYDDVFSTIPNLSKITRLNTLVFDQIESKCLKNLLDQLQSLSSLSSLSISVIDATANKTEIFQQLFCLSTLKFCKVSFNEGSNIDLPLPIATTNEQSSIEHFSMTNTIFIQQVDSLLSYLPQLSHLCLHLLNYNQQATRKQSDLVLSHLTHLSVRNEDIKFDDFAQIIIDLFPNIQVLNFTQMNHPSPDRTYTNATKWKQLITSHLKKLRTFNIQLNTKLENSDYDNQFLTPFWIDREWFITHEICSFHDGNYLNLYSIKPYKQKSYTLSKSSDSNNSIYNDKSNLNSVRHVLIEDKRGLQESIYRFPNANELTFQQNFSTSSLSLITILNNILPLKQITKLIIDCRRFSLKKVIELIDSTPNLRTLKLTSMPLFKDNHETIQKCERFQSVSATNNVTHVIYSDICKLENLKLLVALCPRMKHLTISTYAQDLQINVWFLLDKKNEHTRHLCSLHFTFANAIWTKRLNRLFQTELLIRNYTLKFLDHKLYLSW